MSDRHILFSAPMIRALLDGRKTQTRRVIPGAHPKFPHYTHISPEALKFDPSYPAIWYWDGVHDRVGASFELRIAVGDRLWVKETAERVPDMWAYRADGELVGWPGREPLAHFERDVCSSMFLPRKASRLTLIVEDVRVQRLMEISEEDARAEGFPISWDGKPYDPPSPEVYTWQGYGRASFFLYWSKLHGPGAWESNPWIAAYTFSVIKANIDQVA